jgi:Domain of unknown function (DUF3850)
MFRKMIHELKTWPEYYKAVVSGKKNFEVRKADRLFEVGDLLALKEYDPETQKYTGKLITKEITYILPGGQFGINLDYVVLGIL